MSISFHQISLTVIPYCLVQLRSGMAEQSRRGGWKKNAIVTGVVLSPIAVLIVLFVLLNQAYQAELEGGAATRPVDQRADQPQTQPRALP
ncbi:MAG: hypothetical protein RIA68_07265 [Phycisphaerales bacterium]